MFNLVHHHCHFFTDSYKKLICVEFRTLLIVRQVKQAYFWKACLLVVPAGFDPRLNEAQGRYNLFIRKSGKNFSFYINYKIFNTIIMKNKYLLPLIQKFKISIIKIKYFTKLNIVVVFNKIKIIENEK